MQVGSGAFCLQKRRCDPETDISITARAFPTEMEPLKRIDYFSERIPTPSISAFIAHFMFSFLKKESNTTILK